MPPAHFQLFHATRVEEHVWMLKLGGIRVSLAAPSPERTTPMLSLSSPSMSCSLFGVSTGVTRLPFCEVMAKFCEEQAHH